ncbi:hypothetical protein PAMP_008089 [Pampus punctatissimus]
MGSAESLSQHSAFWDSLEPSPWAVPPADKPGGSGGAVLNEWNLFVWMMAEFCMAPVCTACMSCWVSGVYGVCISVEQRAWMNVCRRSVLCTVHPAAPQSHTSHTLKHSMNIPS